MNRRLLFVLAAHGFFAASLSSADAQSDPDRSEFDVFSKISKFFEDLMNFSGNISDKIDNQKLHDYLFHLGQSIDGMIFTKRAIAGILNSSQSIDKTELDEEIDGLRLDAKSVSSRLRKVSFQLRLEFHDEGKLLAAEFDNALLGKNLWLDDLTNNRASLSLQQRNDLSVRALKSADALDVANTALAKLIEKLGV